ncbi:MULTISPECIES: sensor domain-containing protein [Bradyrhizobium]|uniref:sensor domain-containing protein n=1 Tax=Bradyrhizobium elkanii TaxID=29448 RepID=UPI0027152ABA|nr:bifunctional diguanylate cyclase/phosphodiesterase [Bradyrhizobium elkanii]WLA51316.1 EAL domain-containing protein [Bradyrhizobium elkanii]WLB78414.1 EAL domain-containing protein [Bradyrhizobium elkanii]
MAARKLSQGQAPTREARRRWHEERSLRCAIRLARMGYWESQSAAATDLWISPELAAFYEFETADGYIPIATVRERYLPESRKLLEAHYAACWAEGRPYAVRTRLRGPDGSLLDCVVHGEPEFDARGQVRRVSGIVRDVTEETSALRRLAESEQRLADFVSTASDWCWESDAEHRLLPYPKSLAGNAAFQTVAAGRKARWELTYAPEDGEAMARHRADMEAHRPFRDFTYTLIGKDGSRVSICTSGKPIFADDGSFLGYRGTSSDITQLRAAKALLDQRTRALEEAHRLGKIGTWSHRLESGRTIWAPELYQLLGLPDTFEPTDENMRPYFLDGDADRFREVQKRVLRTRRTEATDLRILHADGMPRDLAVICKAEVAHDKVIGIIGTVQDVTERKEAERQLEQLAYSDPLTGLANRALFTRQLAALTEGCSQGGRTGALLLIDLDRFKEVNDSLGHAAGDELLIKVAAALRQDLGPRAFIARLGGDEFAVLADGCDTSDAALTGLADRLIGKLSGPVDLAEGEASVGATIGIARLPEHGATAETAVRNADLALYMAKEAGRGRAQLFEPVYAQAVDERLDLGRHLRHAVEAGALEAHYQPQVDLKTGRVTGFEALLRWAHPERGPISPAEFIPIAESSGLIVDLGLWVLREACRQGRAWLDAGLPPRSISVNVSPAQIWSVDFETAVSAILAETGFPAELLCLELTESLFVDHTEQRISRTLTALSGLGARLALDDFGSGYSSLGYLTRLPFDCLKVDRAFVDGISTAPEKRKLLGGIIALSHGLGMTVVAEGAELSAELDVLGGLDCDVVQGFVLSPPVAADKAPLVAASIEREARRIQPKWNRL